MWRCQNYKQTTCKLNLSIVIVSCRRWPAWHFRLICFAISLLPTIHCNCIKCRMCWNTISLHPHSVAFANNLYNLALSNLAVLLGSVRLHHYWPSTMYFKGVYGTTLNLLCWHVCHYAAHRWAESTSQFRCRWGGGASGQWRWWRRRDEGNELLSTVQINIDRDPQMAVSP